MTAKKEAQARFAKKDVAEVATGACIMAFPVTVTEEVWNLGAELSLPHVLFFALASISFLALMIYMLQHGSVGSNRRSFCSAGAQHLFSDPAHRRAAPARSGPVGAPRRSRWWV